MKKKIITRTIKNIILLISILLSVLFLLFGLFFSDFKEKAFFNAKKDYTLNVDRYTNKLENKIILFDKVSVEEYVKDAKDTDFIENIKINY